MMSGTAKNKSPFEGKQLALFDLDGTIRETRPNGLDAFFSYGAEAGIEFDKVQRRQVVRWTYKYWAHSEALIRDQKKLKDGEFWENYIGRQVDACGLNGSQASDAASKIYVRFRDEFAPEPYVVPGARELLWSLRSEGIRTGLVSNRDEPLTGLAIELGIVEHFNFTLAAGQIDSWKPDAAIFRSALSIGGNVEPAEAVYIGDNYYADVVGAKAVGMDAVLIDREEAFPEARQECMVVSRLDDLTTYASSAS